MKLTFVFLIGAVVLLGATGAVAADSGQTGVTAAADSEQPGAPPWQENETTTGNDSTGISPGQTLAGAIGAQGASVQGELWNRTLSERLENATTTGERAEIVTEETDLLVASVEALEETRENLTEAWVDGELSEGEYRASLSELVVRAYFVELRANQTVRAAENIPPATREVYDVNATEIRDLSERATALYEFEGEIAQEVANETLSNRSTETQLWGQRAD